MTNLEALKAKVGYPLSDNALIVALSSRDIIHQDTFSVSANVSGFELAYADSLITILSTPSNVSEGGYSVSVSDRKILSELANKIYLKYDESSPVTSTTPKATFRQSW